MCYKVVKMKSKKGFQTEKMTVSSGSEKLNCTLNWMMNEDRFIESKETNQYSFLREKNHGVTKTLSTVLTVYIRLLVSW